MRRFGVLVAAISLVGAACSGGTGGSSSTTSATTSTALAASSTTATSAAPSTTTTAAAGLTATSDDGMVTVDVPPGALAADPGIAVTRLDPADYPEDMASLEVEPWVWALEPGALQFDAPVQMTVEVPIEGFEGTTTPLVTLVTTASDGSGWELLGDQVFRRDGDVVTITGTSDHFSRLAAVPEQVLIETRFLDVSRDAVATLGVDFRWSNGVLLSPPATGTASFGAGGTDAGSIPATLQDGLFTLQCPTGISGLDGDFSLELLLPAVDGTTGETGVTETARLAGVDPTVRTTADVGLHLVCRPTISADGSTVRLDVAVDHPGGEVIIPDEDFRGGYSGMLLQLAQAFPGLFVGLIRDVNSDGVIGPDDVMYPPYPATVSGGTTSVVLPLYGYGDYFPYFLDGEPPELATEVLVSDGEAILLGGLTREQTSVPYLGNLPFPARVFSDESTTSDDVELLVLLTPRILEGDGE